VLEYKVSKKQIDIAKKLYDFNALKGSITKGRSNIYGALGEVIIYDFYTSKNIKVKHNPTYDYDMIIEGHRIDVKTKRTTVKPKPHYLCSIKNPKQNCDYYFFVRILEDLSVAYLLGYKQKGEYYKEAIYKTKGEKDVNGWTFKDDCYNLEISKLNKFK